MLFVDKSYKQESDPPGQVGEENNWNIDAGANWGDAGGGGGIDGNIGSGILRFVARRRCNPGQDSTLPLEKHNFFFYHWQPIYNWFTFFCVV